MESSEFIEISENEIKFQAIRSSGARGKYVNKVSSAIRVKHLKTGLKVLVMDRRPRHQNKKNVLQRLQEKVVNYNIEKTKG